MTAFSSWALARLHVLTIALICAAILHIAATLTAPRFATATPFVQLTKLAPLHAFNVLPPVTPKTQPLAFMAPDVRYAMCRYDTSKGPVTVQASLPGRGWTLSLYTPDGDNIYTSVGSDAQPTDVALQLTPTADRFLGLTPEARGIASEKTATLAIPTGRGLVIVRAPDLGQAYANQTEAVLKRATCTAKPF